MKNIVLLLFPKVGVNPIKPQPPLSLLAISPYIMEQGLTPVIIDQRVSKDYEQQLKAILPETLFVGITSMTGEQLAYASELILLVKRISPDTPVVFGGVHASLLPEQTIQMKEVDIVAIGEGESVIADIIKYYQGQISLSTIKGIYYRAGDKVLATPPRPLMDLANLKVPSWKLIDKNSYSEFGVQCGRGCPHQCTFCYNIKFNERKWRFRHPDSILEEIKFLHFNYEVNDLLFLDDNFFTSFDRVSELCKLIIQNNINIKWGTTCRADYYKRFTPEFVDLLKRSGLHTLFVGGESGSPETLKRIKKGITVEDNISMAEVSKKYSLQTVVSFMSGFPFETQADRYMTYNLMDKMRAINPDLRINGANIYTPYPGNDLFEESKKFGLVQPATLTGWSTFVFNMSNLPWLSKAENRMLANISFITRFYFWYKALKERFLKPYHYPFYWILRMSAIIRWKFRAFNAAWEWDLFRVIRKTFLE